MALASGGAYVSSALAAGEGIDRQYGSPPPSDASREAAPLAGGRGESLVRALGDSSAERAREARERRTSAEAGAARLRSREAYRAASGAESGDVFRREFGAVLESLAFDPLRAVDGASFASVLGDRTALIRRPGKPNLLAVSASPLGRRGGSGEIRALDLRLERREGEFVPRNGMPSLALPLRGDGRVRLPHGLAIRFEAAPGSDGGRAVAHDERRHLFYANVAADTDLALLPLPDGVEAFAQLRSPASPEIQTFQVGLPEGALLRASGDGSIEVVRDGDVLAVITRPWAVDAQANPVSVSLRIAGRGEVELVTRHRGADVAYPVLVDPAITTVDDHDSGGRVNSWWWVATDGDYAPRTACFEPLQRCYSSTWQGLYIYAPHSTIFQGGQWGEWVYEVYGSTTYVPHVSFGRLYYTQGSGYQDPYLYLGIFSGRVGGWTGLETFPTVNLSNATIDVPAGRNVANPDTTGGRTVAFGMYARTDTVLPAWRDAMLGRSVIYLDDPEPPSVDLPSEGLALPGWTEADSLAGTLVARDPGLGVKTMRLEAPGAAAQTRTHSCTATTAQPCPAAWSQDFTVNSALLPEGINELRATATDVLSKQSPQRTWQVRIDRDKPTVAVDGPLYALRNQDVPDGVYNVHAQATDGDASSNQTARSGVEHIEILLDGDVVEERDADCPTHSCELELDWELDTSSLVGGAHRITVLASDQLEHDSELVSFTFTKACCLGAQTQSSWIAGQPQFGDVTGDGRDDAVGRDALGRFRVAASNGSGFGAAADWGQGPAVASIEIADADGDGFEDVLWQDLAAGVLRVARSDGGSFGAATVWGSAPGGVRAQFADVDGDALADVVLYEPLTGVVSAGYSGGGSFETPFVWTTWDTAYDFALADVTGDLAADAIGRNSAGDVRVGVSTAGAFAPAVSWGTQSADDVIFADVDGDDVADAVGKKTVASTVDYGSSDGESFEPMRALGGWSVLGLDAADVSGDGVTDLVGFNRLSAQLVTAPSNAPTPRGALAEIGRGDDGVDVEEDALDQGNSGTIAGVGEPQRPPGRPRLASEDDRILQYGERDGAATHTQRGQVYGRLREAGVTVMRFVVYWGGIENRPVRPDSNGNPEKDAQGRELYWQQPRAANGSRERDANGVPLPLREGTVRYDWRLLDPAVREAVARGMHVHLTLTGTGINGITECGATQNFAGIGCDANENPLPTGIDPGSALRGKFREFVAGAVTHYTTDPDMYAYSYGIWNEPNLEGSKWLAADDGDGTPYGPGGKPDRGDLDLVPVKLYRQLYREGYAGWEDAGSPLGTQVMIGELTSGARVGRSDATSGRCPRGAKERCPWDPMHFLESVVGGAGEDTFAHGVAYHPYQHRKAPTWQQAKRKKSDNQPVNGAHRDLGIGRLGDVQKAIRGLCAPIVQRRCASDPDEEQLRAPRRATQPSSEGTPRPGLYLTEFGYHNQPTTDQWKGRRNGNWHTERIRRDWFVGTAEYDGALNLAEDAGAKWVVLYHAVEHRPEPFRAVDPLGGYKDEYGLFDLARGNAGEDIKGDRPYGKDLEQKPQDFRIPAERFAYCGIRRWAILRKYFGPGTVGAGKFPLRYMNACRRPKWARDAD